MQVTWTRSGEPRVVARNAARVTATETFRDRCDTRCAAPDVAPSTTISGFGPGVRMPLDQATRRAPPSPMAPTASVPASVTFPMPDSSDEGPSVEPGAATAACTRVKQSNDDVAVQRGLGPDGKQVAGAS